MILALQAAAAIELRWSAPAECPDREQVRSGVVHLLGGSIPRSAHLPMVDATVTHDAPPQWALDLRFQTDGAVTERSVKAESCAQIGEIAALVIALAIDPQAVAEQRARQVSQPSKAPLAIIPSVVTRVRAGLLPQSSFGAGLGLALVRGAIRLQIELIYGVPQSPSFADDRAADFDVPLEGTLTGCFSAWHRGRVQVEACTAFAMAALRGTGRNITHPTTTSALWLGLGAGPALEVWPWRRLGLRGSLELGYSPSDAAFFIEGVGVEYRTPSVWGGGGLALEMMF